LLTILCSAVPHSLWTSSESRICLITADPPSSQPKAYKELIQHSLFPEDLKPRISRVIAVSKLKTKYKSFESLRQLVAEHDLFLADERIISLLPKLLGKTFYKATTKRPVPVSLTGRENYHGKNRETGEGKLKRKRDKETGGPETIGQPLDVGTDIQKALDSTLVHLAPAATTAIRVAWAGWPVELVADNIEAVVEGMVTNFVPKGWRGLKSLHIKSPKSIALPVWLADELWADDEDVLNQEAPFAEETFNKKRPRVKTEKSKSDDKLAVLPVKWEMAENEGDAPAPKKAKKMKREKDAAANKLKESTMRKEDLEIQKRQEQREAQLIAETFKVTKKKEKKVPVVSDVASKKSAVEPVSV
jgi:ribosome biogenesis protein UTP30